MHDSGSVANGTEVVTAAPAEAPVPDLSVVVPLYDEEENVDPMMGELLDVLDGLDHIEICTSYRFGSRTITEFPSDSAELAACQPVYESWPGWSTPTRGVRRFADLPENARRYVARLEEVSGVPAAIISTGSERDDTIFRDEVAKSALSAGFVA